MERKQDPQIDVILCFSTYELHRLSRLSSFMMKKNYSVQYLLKTSNKSIKIKTALLYFGEHRDVFEDNFIRCNENMKFGDVLPSQT